VRLYVKHEHELCQSSWESNSHDGGTIADRETLNLLEISKISINKSI
jgi:hypothetical protein